MRHSTSRLRRADAAPLYVPYHLIRSGTVEQRDGPREGSAVIRGLDMSGAGLVHVPEGLLRSAFLGFALTELYLQKNSLKSLPASFGMLRNLRILDASYNSIAQLPTEFGNLHELRELNLSCNRFTELQMDIFGHLLRLELCSLEGNPFSPPLPPGVTQSGQYLFRFCCDNMPIPMAPAERVLQNIIPEAEQERLLQAGHVKLNVVCYNVLAEIYATSERHPYCFAEDTQLLTDRGFLGLDEVLRLWGTGLQFCGFDSTTGKLCYEYPIGDGPIVNNAVERNELEMVEFEGDGVSLLVTPDHDMWVADDDGVGGVAKRFRKEKAGSLVGRAKLILFQAAAPSASGGDSGIDSVSVVECSSESARETMVVNALFDGKSAAFEGSAVYCYEGSNKTARISNVRRVAGYRGRTWCVTLPCSFVVARRVEMSTSPDAFRVARAWRPTIQGNCPTWALAWSYRKHRLMQEIVYLNADIICLQEVETAQFREFFQPSMASAGYEGIFQAKSRARTMGDTSRVDGCAIFWRRSLLSLVEEHVIEFQNVAAQRMDEFAGESFDRLVMKDNVALLALLELWATGTKILVANTHIHWNPEFSDVKLIQTQMFLEKLTEMRHVHSRPTQRVPLIVAGDFNSTPDSGVFSLLTSGRLSPNHPELRNHSYGGYSNNGMKHALGLVSCYSPTSTPYTNYTHDFKGMLDYVFVTSESIMVGSILQPLPEAQLAAPCIAIPNPFFPSDHILLFCSLFLR